jgi:hypothetical protein
MARAARWPARPITRCFHVVGHGKQGSVLFHGAAAGREERS